MIYLKLALRNAKRSAADYLLYMFTMIILISILCVSNHVAAFGHMRAGFQTAALPFLIMIIMAVLMNYIKTFMIKHRAREFATYILLGMEKKKLSQLFTLEATVIGLVCLILGILAGTGAGTLGFTLIGTDTVKPFGLIIKSIFHTFLYFCVVELISAVRMNRKWNNLQISDLLKEEKRNQRLSGSGKTLWGIVFSVSIVSFLALLYAVVFLPDTIAGFALSLITIPVLATIISFYQWFFAMLASRRLHKSESLYQGLTVYNIAEMTSNGKLSAAINSVFCICLLFSASAFVCGVLFLHENMEIFSLNDQKWMGFLQISQSIIFIVIYFSVISLFQIIEWKRQAKNLKILRYLGKNQAELKSLVRRQILIKFLMPAGMCFALLLITVPFINFRMNDRLPETMHNDILSASGLFVACYATLYLCYFIIVYRILVLGRRVEYE